MCDSLIFITLTLTLVLKIENKNKKENKKKLSLLFLVLTLFSSQGFSSGETDFHFCQFLSNFLRYSFLNFPLSHSYNIFTIYFPGNSPLLKSFSSILSNFSCFLISTLILLSNFSIVSLVFPRSSSLFYVSYSTVNLFQHTKYFSTPLIFLLFKIFFYLLFFDSFYFN